MNKTYRHALDPKSLTVDSQEAVAVYAEMTRVLEDLVAGTSIQLERYFQPMSQVDTTTNRDALRQTMLEQAARSLQNATWLPRVIRYDDPERKPVIDAAAKRPGVSEDELYNVFDSAGFVSHTSKSDRGNEKSWSKYARGLAQFSRYLDDGGLERVCEAVDVPGTSSWDEITQLHPGIVHLPDELTKNVYGLGAALSRDFLKECGCQWLAKPDTHVMNLLVAAELYEQGSLPHLTEEQAARFFINLAQAIRTNENYPAVTPYRLDKMVWLISTGRFYLEKDAKGNDLVENYRALLALRMRLAAHRAGKRVVAQAARTGRSGQLL